MNSTCLPPVSHTVSCGWCDLPESSWKICRPLSWWGRDGWSLVWAFGLHPYVSHWRWPSSNSVILTCDKIKLPSNVLNLKVSVFSATIKAMSVGEKVDDTQFSLTNGPVTEALVPIALCTTDIGDGNNQPIYFYLDDLNNNLRLLTSTVAYINQLRKEVAWIHVVELCKMQCEVGKMTCSHST